DLELRPGRVHALVGESGCGKSTLAGALIGMLPPGTRATGSVRVCDTDVTAALGHPRATLWEGLRGRRIGTVAQSSATYLTPTRKVGSQLRETLAAIDGRHTPEDLLALVGLPAEVLDRYPHELSGGMAGRAAVAFALAGDPEVLLADEPTASLDPELTRSTLALLRRHADLGAAVLLITHDLGALLDTDVADDLSVMYAGRIVEHGSATDVLAAPSHAYTRALLGALPRNGLQPIPGMPPSLTDLDPSVTFADRLEGAHP
ncbi:ATP-binding cassette domain-containing protein, partial [Kribbia dieselivorans]|uniref:ATP-binding cassette domain-containing protein n=1 Tax=Kribbia dieselivorans TaxID=331526 RepID=UPI0008382E0C